MKCDASAAGTENFSFKETAKKMAELHARREGSSSSKKAAESADLDELGFPEVNA